MNINNRLTVNILNTEAININFDNYINLNNKENIQIENLSFGLSPKNDVDDLITHFVVYITNSILNKDEIFPLFKTRTTYQISKFSLYPNQAILEEYTFDAFNEHRNLFNEEIKKYPNIKPKRLQNLVLEKFEKTLKKELSIYINS